jgi:hypothetical protein
MKSRAVVAFVCISGLVQLHDSRSEPTETEAKLLMHGRELMTADIAQARDMSLYDDGGHFDCRTHSSSDTSPRNCDLPKVRDFIWEHWQKKQRGYIRVTADSVDTMSTSHIFVEPNAHGVWHAAWRVAQDRANGSSVIRDLSEFVSITRVDSKLAFRAADGSQTEL